MVNHLAAEMFLCEKYKCRLTYKACADRQAARVTIGLKVLANPLYPGCQNCEQIASPEKLATNLVEKQEISKEENIMATGRVKGTCINCLRPDLMLLRDLCGACGSSITGITDEQERTQKLATAKERLQNKPRRKCNRKPQNEQTGNPVSTQNEISAAPFDHLFPGLPEEMRNDLVADALDPVIPAILEEHPRIIPVKLKLDIEVIVHVMAVNA